MLPSSQRGTSSCGVVEVRLPPQSPLHHTCGDYHSAQHRPHHERSHEQLHGKVFVPSREQRHAHCGDSTKPTQCCARYRLQPSNVRIDQPLSCGNQPLDTATCDPPKQKAS